MMTPLKEKKEVKRKRIKFSLSLVYTQTLTDKNKDFRISQGA